MYLWGIYICMPSHTKGSDMEVLEVTRLQLQYQQMTKLMMILLGIIISLVMLVSFVSAFQLSAIAAVSYCTLMYRSLSKQSLG